MYSLPDIIRMIKSLGMTKAWKLALVGKKRKQFLGNPERDN